MIIEANIDLLMGNLGVIDSLYFTLNFTSLGSESIQQYCDNYQIASTERRSRYVTDTGSGPQADRRWRIQGGITFSGAACSAD